MAVIESVYARQILDSRGNPTVQVVLDTEDGAQGLGLKCRLALREGQRVDGNLDRRLLARLDLDLLSVIAQHLHADDRRTVLAEQQVIVIKLLVVLRDDQRADAFTHAVDRHDRRVLAVEEALRILFIGAHARLRAQVGTSLIHAHEPADVVLRELALVDDLVDHEIAFEVVDKGIAVNLALLVGDIDVCIQDIAEHTRNAIVFYIFRTLKQTIDLACFFQ